jgi:integrase
MEEKTTISIASAIEDYLQFIKLTRSENTALTYGKALKEFKKILVKEKVNPEDSSTSAITEDLISKFVQHLNAMSSATEQLYVGAIARFSKYLVVQGRLEINLPRIEILLKQRTRRTQVRLPRFSTYDVERVLNFVSDIPIPKTATKNELLRALRDRAFLLTLADTGLRVNEACNLRLGNVNWNKEHAIINNGDKQAVVRFTTRSMRALKDYLSLRAELDGGSGKQLTALPLFARHDKGTGKKVKPITPTTGRNIVAERVRQALGNEAEGHITPHSFRHYFVSTILRASGNLKLAQALARHENIQITQRYAHIDDDELDKGYYEIFEKNKET